ncbi:unnamed protein product, partial [Leptidea sinapis]
MPIDFRRFNGPEDSIPYKAFTSNCVRTYDELYKDLFDDSGKRKDGRALDEMRSMYARTGMVSQAKGSSYIEQNRTKVVCSVFDPREISHQNEFSDVGQLYCEVKFAPFSCPRRRRPHAPDTEERALSSDLRKALESVVCRDLFPNFQIDIFVYILEHDGSCLAAALNAAGLALVDAAVPIFVDPTEEEEHLALTRVISEKNHGLVTACMYHNLRQICDLRQIGSINMETIKDILVILENNSGRIEPYMEQIIVTNVEDQCEEQQILDEESKIKEKALNAMAEE